MTRFPFSFIRFSASILQGKSARHFKNISKHLKVLKFGQTKYFIFRVLLNLVELLKLCEKIKKFTSAWTEEKKYLQKLLLLLAEEQINSWAFEQFGGYQRVEIWFLYFLYFQTEIFLLCFLGFISRNTEIQCRNKFTRKHVTIVGGIFSGLLFNVGTSI